MHVFYSLSLLIYSFAKYDVKLCEVIFSVLLEYYVAMFISMNYMAMFSMYVSVYMYFIFTCATCAKNNRF
jgi:hypothetical protein